MAIKTDWHQFTVNGTRAETKSNRLTFWHHHINASMSVTLFSVQLRLDTGSISNWFPSCHQYELILTVKIDGLVTTALHQFQLVYWSVIIHFTITRDLTNGLYHYAFKANANVHKCLTANVTKYAFPSMHRLAKIAWASRLDLFMMTRWTQM